MKVWRRAFLVVLAEVGEEREAAERVGITDRRVRQLKRADPRFKAQVTAALVAYEEAVIRTALGRTA